MEADVAMGEVIRMNEIYIEDEVGGGVLNPAFSDVPYGEADVVSS